MNKIRHLYIHIPISKSNCEICDINKIEHFSLEPIIEEMGNKKLDKKLKTLYIGGLNPGDLNKNSLKRLFLAISKRFSSIDEFTFETYPESLTKEKIHFLKRSGVNRVVLKVKTFSETILNKWSLKNETSKIFEVIRSVGFNNISIDMNFGFNKGVLQKDIECVLKLAPESIHWYSHSMQGDIADLKFISKKMESNSYYRYELTGFAKPGFESQQSMAYWKSKNWLGIGSGAYSFVDTNYNGNELIGKELAQQVIMMALHYKTGLDLSLELHNYSYQNYKNELDLLVSQGKLIKEGGFIFIDKKQWENIDDIIKNIL